MEPSKEPDLDDDVSVFRDADRRGRVRKASDVVAARMRAQILGEAMPVGLELPTEAKLIETFGFSRSTVREGLRLLEADGLIVARRGPGGGVFVSRPSIEQISRSMAILFTSHEVTYRELLEFRRLIEPPMAALAARNATLQQRRSLLALARTEQDEYSGVNASVNFHEAVAVCTSNKVARIVMAAMRSALVGHVDDRSLSDEQVHGTTNVHLRLAELISDERGDEAQEAMEHHLEAFMRYLADQNQLDRQAVSGRYWREPDF
jgi:GntR family transcriptional repressor for pyruvate dehydrogenase complex